MRRFEMFMLTVSAACAVYALYLHRFVRRYADDASDLRRQEQAGFYRRTRLATRMATGALITFLIAAVNFFSP